MFSLFIKNRYLHLLHALSFLTDVSRIQSHFGTLPRIKDEHRSHQESKYHFGGYVQIIFGSDQDWRQGHQSFLLKTGPCKKRRLLK
ncbi:putative uncharacterized protein encoded by LINC00158 [Macaca nemestrina]|uniref:putative uncharacterized protein encoded by LINC00158 n=1 Tax=Macaca nemestrina TaxID=9545 RepID=UPI00027F2B87|nr:putative uncharacterized protein encoded by LINC00158 [Macaca nemestrina]XP_011885228.1 PREDICTED: putative uncharacterized protein encoded by LINC00158 [Cercocebus atys]XP_014988569.2 putative uncharacterized protein encoded by LINC00158 [Macaca mulatta]XP_015302441.1 putative uncharacterized protein encoded by LINC00158 [Macaca fascicularis]XP_017811989.1 putative uncharacterized protein encoded by LINC00158 [Papio anubis]